MISYKKDIKSIRNNINLLLPNYISVKDCKMGKRVAKAMLYSLMVGGKRIRPALCLGATKLVGGSTDLVMPIACAIEMIHTYSLIHDDLPVMDDDSLRRGNLTCHKQFDEATAILAGDALLTLAFEIITELGFKNKISLKFSKNIFRIMHKISVAAGFKGMIGGQMKDISSEGVSLSEKKIKHMHILKTGMLIEASVICGAFIGDANDHQIEQLKCYSYNLGLAFQVTDDILNVVGKSVSLGKTVGSDSIRSKNTYPATIGINAAKKLAIDLINKALKALNLFDKKADLLRGIAHYLLESEARKIKNVKYLAQGTLYPDIIESCSAFGGKSSMIKSHHNVGGLPKNMKLKLIEPLKYLFKDEVRSIANTMGLDESITWRQPFPGPGLAIRIIGEVTQEKLFTLREIDAVLQEEIRNAGYYKKLWQSFAVLLSVKSVGIMGDKRTYENIAALRAVTSSDAMTADWARLPYDLLATISNRIINEVRGINRVMYDISSKPPSTIEFE